jgi:hypothetical protein
MDILSARGQDSLMHERIVSMWIENKWKCRYIETPKDSPALVDAIITDEHGGVMKAVVETKCRYNVTLPQFQTKFNNQWLVTWDKVQNAMKIATSLGVNCIGLLYLVEDKTLMVQKLCDAQGNLMAEMLIKNTTTQATINGGSIARNNAYISMDGAKIYNLKEAT